MSGNTIGKMFCVTTFGESHGKALGCIVDGTPPGLKLSCEDLQYDLNRRRPGTSRYTTPRNELDQIHILSGTFEGMTTGSSIGLLIYNSDQRSEDYNHIKDLFRPGHADYTYLKKYGIRDYRGGGRSSARETTMRVAAGGIAKKYLKEEYGIIVQAYLSQMGNIKCLFQSWEETEKNSFFCANPNKIIELENLIKHLKKTGDSIGAEVTIVAKNVPIGLGEPVFDRLDADLAHALMSINAVKGVEIGDGFKVIDQKGSEHRDEMTPEGFITNHAGGILGGISNGEDIILKAAFKPTSSIRKLGNTINKNNQKVQLVVKGRHDPCVGIRAIPITEAMVAIVLMDHLLRFRGQCNQK